jgi:peptide/nickel transport system substrate-binding protein
MQRRAFLAGASTAFALPSVARAQSAPTLQFIPQVDLTSLDSHWTTAYVTRNYGHMVFDTLYGQDVSSRRRRRWSPAGVLRQTCAAGRQSIAAVRGRPG